MLNIYKQHKIIKNFSGQKDRLIKSKKSKIVKNIRVQEQNKKVKRTQKILSKKVRQNKVDKKLLKEIYNIKRNTLKGESYRKELGELKVRIVTTRGKPKE